MMLAPWNRPGLTNVQRYLLLRSFGLSFAGGVDNITLNAGAGGSTLGTDDIGGTHYQLIKLGYGALDTFTIVTGSVGLPTDPLDRAARDMGKIDIASLDQYTPVDIDSGGGTVNAIPVTLGVSAAGGAFIGGDVTNGLDVDVTRVPTDPFGANADAAAIAGSISAKLRYLAGSGIAGATMLPAGTNNIGDVDVLTVPTDPFGANADAAAVAGSISAKLRWLTAIGIAVATQLPAGTNNIGDVDVLTVPADPFGANADAQAVAGSISAKLRWLASTGVAVATSLPAGVNNIGDVDVLTVPSDPFGANADAASPTGSLSAKLRWIAGTGIGGATMLPTGTNSIGIVDTELPAAGALADNMANPTTPLVGACLMQFDGTTWDRVRAAPADDSAFTVATDLVSPVGFLVDEVSPDSADEGDVGLPRMTADRKLLVRIVGATDGNRLQITATGDALVSVATSLPAGTNNIGDVDVLTVPADPFGANADAANPLGSISAKLRHLAAVGIAIATQLPAGTNVIGYVTGSVAHDSPDSTSPNPVKIGAFANTSLDDETMVADADRVNLNADLDGVLIVKEGAPFSDLGTERRTDIGGVATQLSTFFGATSNVRNMISAITVANTHASTSGYVDILDGSGGAAFWTIPAPFAGGAHIPFNPPLRQPSANTALGYKVNTGIATMILSFHGFRSKA